MDIPGPEPHRLRTDFGADPAAGFTGESADEPTVTTPLEPAMPDTASEDRVTYRELVAALTRRNQSLVRLQLELAEQLKSGLADAAQVAALFQVERLAAKMRRNNENLIALSRDGTERETDPVPAGELLQAAVAEIEQHTRVGVGPPISARIAARAAGDLSRLLAELLDNATTLSGPETQVALATTVFEGGGLLIDVEDQGVGMTDTEIAVANARLAGRATVDASASSPLGLLVAGQLAERHGVVVTVRHGRAGRGVWVTVVVPAELVTDVRETVPIPLLSPAAETPGTPRTPETPQPLAEDVAPPGTGSSAPAGDSSVSLDWSRDPQAGSPWPGDPGLGFADTAPDAPAEPAESPGSDLFTAEATAGYSDWLNGVPASSASSAAHETTPIFDEMVSAWFSSSSPTPEPASVSSRPATTAAGTWDSAADAGWRVVEAVSRSEPASYTGAGLPRRRRGEQLMPGAIAPTAASPVPETGQDRPRDAAGVRGRLSNFQRGLKRARRGEEDGRRGRHRASTPDADDGIGQ